MIRSFNKLIPRAIGFKNTSHTNDLANKYSKLRSSFNFSCMRLIHKGFQFHFSSTKDQTIIFDSIEQNQRTKILNLLDQNEENILISQFKSKIEEVSSYEAGLDLYQSTLNTMIERQDNDDKIHQLCDIAIKYIVEKHGNTKEKKLIEIKCLQALSLYRNGKIDDSIRVAIDAKNTFVQIKESLGDDEKIIALYHLQEAFLQQRKDQMAKACAQRCLQLIAKNNQENDEDIIFSVYKTLFLSYFNLRYYEKALQYSQMAADQVDKREQKNQDVSQMFLLASQICQIRGDQSQSDFYLDKGIAFYKGLSSSWSQSDEQYVQENHLSGIEQLKKHPFFPFLKDEIESEDIGVDMSFLGYYDEAIDFYLSKLKALNPKIDALEIAYYKYTLSLQYHQKKDINKAIELGQEVYQQIWKHKFEDNDAKELLIYYNSKNLMDYYFAAGNKKEGIEWAIKWYTYSHETKAFNTYSQSDKNYISQIVNILSEQGRHKEALHYCKILEDYQLKFYNEGQEFELYKIKMKLLELYYVNNDLQSSLKYAEEAFELIQTVLKLDQSQKSKEDAFCTIKNLVALCNFSKDKNKLEKYGLEYIKLMSYFYKDCNHKGLPSQYLNDTEKALSQLLKIINIYVNQVQFQEFLLSALAIAQTISTLLSPFSLENRINYEISMLSSIIYIQQQDYTKCLPQIDRTFTLMKKVSDIQLQEKKKLLLILQSIKSETYRNSALEIAKKHNFSV